MKIYKPNGDLLIDVAVDDNSYRHREIMGDNDLTLYFSTAEHIEIPVGAYTDFGNERYTLDRPEALKMHHSRYFEYTVTMQGAQAKAKIWKFRNPVDGRLKFPLTAKPKEHLQMFVDNMNIRDTGWTVGECIDGVETLISYDHAYCWDALGQMADTFKTEFEIKGKQVSLRKVEYNKSNPLPLSYGRGNGFVSGVGRSNYSEFPPVEILYAQGGSNNIDPSQYGSSELHLPVGGTLSYDGEHFETEDGFNAANARQYIVDDKGYSIRRLDKDLSSLAEDSLDCSAIYPKFIGHVSEVVTVNEGNHFYDFIDDSIPDTLNFEDCLIEGETMTVIFQDGMLAGRELEVKYHHKASGNKKGRRFEIVPQDIDGVTMPDKTWLCEKGNSYAVFHIMLPQGYINAHQSDSDPKTGAEWDMFRQCIIYMYDNEEERFTFSGTLDGIWAKKDWTNIGGRIVLGGYVLFSDDRFQKDGVRVRIIGIKDYINNPHSPEIDLSNNTVSGSFKTSMQQMESTEVVIDDKHRDAIQFTKRRFRDAKETMSMLEQALLDNFSNSVNPITVSTMAMLVGDESLQFRFVNSKTNPVQVADGITYDSASKQLHCPEGIIQHMTIGITSVSSGHDLSEYKFWNVPEYLSGSLDNADTKYYLYIRASRSAQTAEFYLSQTAVKLEAESGYYNLLVGVLNSEYDGERSFVTLYGFTEVLPGRITTDRVVSGDGQSYFDMVNNAMKLGTALDFNSAGDGKLLLKGTLVQSQSGDTNYIGCYRGEYSDLLTYFQGDEVTYKIDETTSLYRQINASACQGIKPTNTTYWQVIAQGSEGQQGEAGIDGVSPNTAFKSIVFKRSNTAVATPTGGSYASPVPSGWSDGVPTGEEKLWASSRIFSSDGKSPQQSEWTVPRQMTDTADFDVEFSSEETPTAPSGHPNTNTAWSNESDENTIWMATSKKSNGVWSDWQVSRIKGENGTDGTSIKIIGKALAHYSTMSEARANFTPVTSAQAKSSDGTATQMIVISGGYAIVDINDEETDTTKQSVWYCYKSALGRVDLDGNVSYSFTTYKANAGDGFMMTDSGHLFIANDDDWQDVGQIKGDKGDTGSDGKTAYLHIKYAKSLTENDWSDNNGETPAAYIGIYTDYNVADKLVWSLYTWSKWQGEDGNGYEYIFKRTSSATAPDTPTDTSQDDDFVPSGWTDDPSGVDATNQWEWVCYRKKTSGTWGSFIGSASDNTRAALWAKYGQTGATGATGATGNYTEVRFAKNGSTTSAPTLDRTAKEPSGWSLTTPTVGTAEYLWVTTAIKTSAGALVSQWNAPVRLSGINGKDGSDGKDGNSPVMVYRGVYDSTKTYYGNQYRLDVVKYNGAYNIARIDAGAFSNISPTDTAKWNDFGASFESVATALLLAEYANIAGFIFKNSVLISQVGMLNDALSEDYENSSFIPAITLDALKGNILLGKYLKLDKDGFNLLNSSGLIAARITNQSVAQQIDTTNDSDSQTVNYSDTGAIYVPTSTLGYRSTAYRSVYRHLGYMYKGSKIYVSGATFSCTPPTTAGGNTLTFDSYAIIKIRLYCSGYEKVLTKTITSSSGTITDTIDITVDGSTIPEGDYYIEYQWTKDFYISKSSGSAGLSAEFTLYVTSGTYRYQRAISTMLLIGNNGLFNRWSSTNYLLSTTTGHTLRYGNYILRVSSSGLQKSTDGGSTWTSL